MSGRYHQPVKRAFADAGFEVRTVHPFATKQFRLPADPGNKTDDTVIFRSRLHWLIRDSGSIGLGCNRVLTEPVFRSGLHYPPF